MGVMRGIVLHLEHRAGHFIHGGQFVFALLGVGFHGAEFEDGEGLAVEAAAPLAEQNRAGRTEFDEQADQTTNGRAQNDDGERGRR